MAEPLKDSFGRPVVNTVADMVTSVYPPFDRSSYLATALDGFEELELTPRAKRVSDALATVLPSEGTAALEIITAALDYRLPGGKPTGMASFVYMPFGVFIADHGLDHFDLAMRAQLELTQRFTAEFSIRPFLERHTEETLARLETWATHPSEHVRRLVSEGTRPRLPWAGRLPAFQADPTPVLALLERLKDDPSEYVRRSVANNLNDIVKDHPELVVDVARRWWADGDSTRRKLVRHALRTLIKQGHAQALGLLGYEADSPAVVGRVTCAPPSLDIGESVRIEIHLSNPSETAIDVLVDLRVHFVKGNGSTSPKVFKGAVLRLAPGASATVKKSVSVRQHSTRTHYPGAHPVDVLVNGVVHGDERWGFTLR
jgi:3-methyladenine DNA glycosylase AlkC